MNKNIWNLYKNSERGKDAIALFNFESEEGNLDVKLKEIFKKYSYYFGEHIDEDYFLDTCSMITGSILASKLFIAESENATEYFERLIDNLEIRHVE